MATQSVVLASSDSSKRPVSKSGPSIISADVRMKGSLVSEGEMQIDGQIEGDIRSSAVTIGDSGMVKGEIIADSVVVRGQVTGSIRARKVQLLSGARVNGDITHHSLAIEASALFEGHVRHSEDPLSGKSAGGKTAPTSSTEN